MALSIVLVNFKSPQLHIDCLTEIFKDPVASTFEIIEVDIPYPRSPALVTSRRYRELVHEASAAVHEEARKAFELGEKEG